MRTILLDALTFAPIADANRVPPKPRFASKGT
jgi:hypothetical protein